MTDDKTCDKPKNGMSAIEKHWKIVVFVGSVIVAWTMIKVAVADNTATNLRQEVRIEQLGTNIAEIGNDIVEIKTTLEFIKEQVK